MSHGRRATLVDLRRAICMDVPLHATDPMLLSALELATAYHGWTFVPDPAAIVYGPPFCPR